MKRVGFVIGPQGANWQGTYYDKFQKNAKLRPWLEDVPAKYHIDENGDKWSKKNPEAPFVRIDVAVGYGLKYFLANSPLKVKYDIIRANEISVAKFKQYDLVINQFMDLLIVPFMKMFEKNGVPHRKLFNIFEKSKDRLYPPFEYHKLIVNKCSYYEFLKSHGVPIAPTLCVQKTDLQKDVNKVLADLTNFVRNHKLTSVFTKPIHGTDSTGVKLFDKVQTPKFKADIVKHMRTTFRNKQYPGMVIQKYAKDFEARIPQARLYFIGDQYQYTVLTKRGDTFRPRSEDPSSPESKFVPLPCLKRRAQEILKLFKPYFGNKPMLMTRVDFGCCLKTVSSDSKKQCANFFINEIEFNGGNYVHMNTKPDRRFMYDKKVIQQLIKVIKKV